MEVVIFIPIGIGDILTKGASPGLTAVDTGTDACGFICGDDKAITPAEGAEQEV